MQISHRKPEGLVTGHFRHFASKKVFFSSEGKSKTSANSKLFVTLENG